MTSTEEKRALKDAYALIAELWCSPPEEEATRQGIRSGAADIIARLRRIEPECAESLSRFLDEESLPEEDYIDLFELDPRCPLYLGSHNYDEPETCAGAAVSDRNEYMIELSGIYSHFGQKLNGRELPDYLPLMVDFLSLTADAKGDPLRGKFIGEYILPYLPPMRSRLEELETPYLHLLDALEKVMNIEMQAQASSTVREQKVDNHVG
jgi:nitrate reductase delta subunit